MRTYSNAATIRPQIYAYKLESEKISQALTDIHDRLTDLIFQSEEWEKL
jgi:hypothetical protein